RLLLPGERNPRASKSADAARNMLRATSRVFHMVASPEAAASAKVESTQSIRTRIHKTRAALNRKLDLLKTRIFGPAARTTPMARRMSAATKKAAGKKSAAKKKKIKAPRSAARKKKPAGARTRATKSTKMRRPAPKATKVIGEVLTGAALGAVKGAAEAL